MNHSVARVDRSKIDAKETDFHNALLPALDKRQPREPRSPQRARSIS
jgi:hypothetical protein